MMFKQISPADVKNNNKTRREHICSIFFSVKHMSIFQHITILCLYSTLSLDTPKNLWFRNGDW